VGEPIVQRSAGHRLKCWSSHARSHDGCG
jgi:hypothetical protein